MDSACHNLKTDVFLCTLTIQTACIQSKVSRASRKIALLAGAYLFLVMIFYYHSLPSSAWLNITTPLPPRSISVFVPLQLLL